MMPHVVLEPEVIAVTEQERLNLAKVEDLLEHLYSKYSQPHLRLLSPEGEEIELPQPVFRLLHQMVYELAQGNSVTIVPLHKMLTTQEAADLLNVSRQYLVELLDAGAIPFTKVGTHRRVHFGDLMEYKKSRDAKRREGLSRLTKKSQKLGLYSRSSNTPECEST